MDVAGAGISRFNNDLTFSYQYRANFLSICKLLPEVIASSRSANAPSIRTPHNTSSSIGRYADAEAYPVFPNISRPIKSLRISLVPAPYLLIGAFRKRGSGHTAPDPRSDLMNPVVAGILDGA